MTDQASAEYSRFRIGGRTPDGDLVILDGDKQVDIMNEHKDFDGMVDITLFARSIRKWRYPHDEEPITEEMRKIIVRETIRLLEAKYFSVRVKVEW